MSRRHRLEALRARRAAGVVSMPAPDLIYEEVDLSLGLPQPIITEALEPIEAPLLRGGYVTCGGCGSYVGSVAGPCSRCRGVL